MDKRKNKQQSYSKNKYSIYTVIFWKKYTVELGQHSLNSPSKEYNCLKEFNISPFKFAKHNKSQNAIS